MGNQVAGSEAKDVFITVRIAASTHQALKQLAERNERTLAGEIRVAAQRHLEAAV